MTKPEEQKRNALQQILEYGAIDLGAKTNYRDVIQICRKHKTPLVDYNLIEQAMHNAMRERESHGYMIWEVNIKKFVTEYLKLEAEKPA